MCRKRQAAFWMPFWAVVVALSSIVGFAGRAASAADEAEDRFPRAYPERIDFGRVRTGTLVQGHASIAFDGDAAEGVGVQLLPPPFVRVTSSTLHLYPEHPGVTHRVSLRIFFEIDTSSAGEFEENLSAVVGTTQASVPIRVEVAEPSSVRRRLLFVDSPFGSEYPSLDRWRETVVRRELDPEYLDFPVGAWIRDRDLTPYGVLVFEGVNLVNLHKRDAAAAIEFARSGGRVVVFACYGFRYTVDGANDLLEPAGLKMDDVDRPGYPTSIVKSDQFAPHALLEGVETLQFHRAAPIGVTDPEKAQILVPAPDLEDRGYVAVGRLGAGEIVAVGTGGWGAWMEMPYEPLKSRYHLPESCDNARFVENVFTQGANR